MKLLLLLFFLAGDMIIAAEVSIPIDDDPQDLAGHSPFVPDQAQDKKHWDRLLLLSSITPNSIVNPFNAEQEHMFQVELAKKNKKLYFFYGSIAVSALVGALGYFGFFGILDPSLEHTLMPALLPTATILSAFTAIFGIAHDVTSVYDGLVLTLHELVLEELNFLAQFLIRKGFSKDAQDMAYVKNIVDTMDLKALQEAYARQGNGNPDEVVSLTRFLDEALIYLKENRIVDESFEVGEEIRLCLLEQKYDLLLNQNKEILQLLKAQQPMLAQ